MKIRFPLPVSSFQTARVSGASAVPKVSRTSLPSAGVSGTMSSLSLQATKTERGKVKIASKQADGNLFTYTASGSNFDGFKAESFIQFKILCFSLFIYYFQFSVFTFQFSVFTFQFSVSHGATELAIVTIVAPSPNTLFSHLNDAGSSESAVGSGHGDGSSAWSHGSVRTVSSRSKPRRIPHPLRGLRATSWVRRPVPSTATPTISSLT